MANKILVVDDIQTNRQILKAILYKDYQILEAENGKEALDILKKEHKNILAVLLDIIMPIMDGYELLGEIKKDDDLALIPVFVTTSSTDIKTELQALSLGAIDFISKPYNPVLIKQRINNIINLRETATIVNLVKRDELTGLYNRNGFFEIAQKMISSHESGYYILTSFDINNFKVINNQYGSERGDELLKLIAKKIQTTFSANDGVCCRMTSDNFAVLYPLSMRKDQNLGDIQKLVPFFDKLSMPITYSVGRYIINDFSLSVSAMYDRATIAKTSVKGRVDIHEAYYDDAMLKKILREQSIVDEMSTALKEKQFQVWFQPQYNHSTGALVGAEALVRWSHPKKGMISPGEFIPVFEKNGFVYELDKYVWEETCSLLRKWIDLGKRPLPVSVNASRYDILRSDFYETITSLTKKYNIPVDLLRVEVTESAFAESTNQIIKIVKKLIDFGFVVEIDDFGSGYSSLNTLKEVPAQVLKLDMRFLEESESGESSQRGGNILQSIIRMANWLGMPVIAEGVETIEQADFLKSIGCNYIQGYLYSKPMSASNFEDLLDNSKIEERMLKLETVEGLDTHSFWDPKSMDTLIFNNYVGAACIFEYRDEQAEMLRVNEKYEKILGKKDSFTHDMLHKEVMLFLDQQNHAILRETILRAIESRDEATCEVFSMKLHSGYPKTFVRIIMRVIANVNDKYLIYCSIEDTTLRHLAEERVAETSAQLQALMDNIDCGVVASINYDEIESKKLFHNNRFYNILGFTKQEFEENIKNSYNLIHPDDAQYVEGIIKNSLQNMAPATFEYRCAKKDGTFIWLRQSLNYINIPAISQKVALNIVYDITEQKETAKELEIQHEKIRNHMSNLQKIMNNIPGGFIQKQIMPDGRIKPVFANEGYCKLLDEKLEVITQNLHKDNLWYIHPDDKFIVKETVSKARKDSTTHTAKYRVLKRDRSFVWVNSYCQKIKDDTGEEYLYIFYGDPDENESKHQTFVTNMASVFSAIMKSSTDLTFVKDENFVYMSCSDAFAKMIGKENCEEVIGKTDYQLFDKTLADKYRNDDLKLLKEKKSLIDYLETIPSADGLPHFSKTSKHILYDSSNKILGIYGIGRDVTESQSAINRLALMEQSMQLGFATYKYNKDGLHCLYYNEGFYKMSGYSFEEFDKNIKEDPFFLIAQEDRKKIQSLIENANKSKSDFIEYTYLCNTKNASPRWIKLKCIFSDYSPNETIIDLVEIDVTEQVIAEEESAVHSQALEKTIMAQNDIVLIYDIAQKLLILPKKYAQIHGVPRVLQNVPECFASLKLGTPEDNNDAIEFFNNLKHTKTQSLLNKYIMCADGDVSCESFYSTTIFDAFGSPKKAIITVDIIRPNENLDETMKECEAILFEMAAENYCNIVKVDFDTNEVYKISLTNGILKEFSLKQNFKTYFKNFMENVHPENREHILEKTMNGNLISAPSQINFTYKAKSDKKNYRWFSTNIKTAHRMFKDGRTHYIANIFTVDINDQMSERIRLKDLSEHDALTDLFNRLKLDEMLSGEYKTLTSCGVLFFDVNDLKKTNDMCGHQIGDCLLCQIGNSLRSIANRNVHAYRYGGDEFVVIACNVDENNLDELLTLSLNRFNNLSTENQLISSSVSVGKAWSTAPLSVEKLISLADKDMYKNKKAHKQSLKKLGK